MIREGGTFSLMVDNFLFVCFLLPTVVMGVLLVGESAWLCLGDLLEEVEVLVDVFSAKHLGEKSRRFGWFLESTSTPSTMLELLFTFSLS